MDPSDARRASSRFWLGAILCFLVFSLLPLRVRAQHGRWTGLVKLRAGLLRAAAPRDGLPGATSPDRLTVLVFDYAGVPAKVRAGAEAEAAYILRRSGLTAQFIDCLLAPVSRLNSPACRPPLDPAALYVRIARQQPSRGLPGDTLGYASIESGGGGQYAGIFYPAVADAAGELEADRYLMLGCVLVHEIGHMLLGPHSHSAEGIMRAQWAREDLLRAGQRTLHFTPAQSVRLRSAVEARTNRNLPGTAASASTLAPAHDLTGKPEAVPLVRFDHQPSDPLCDDATASTLQRSLAARPVNAYVPASDDVLCAAY